MSRLIAIVWVKVNICPNHTNIGIHPDNEHLGTTPEDHLKQFVLFVNLYMYVGLLRLLALLTLIFVVIKCVCQIVSDAWLCFPKGAVILNTGGVCFRGGQWEDSKVGQETNLRELDNASWVIDDKG